MNVIFDAANRQHFHFVLAGNASKIWPEALLQLWSNESAPLFGAKNAMHDATGKRMHGRRTILSSLAGLLL